MKQKHLNKLNLIAGISAFALIAIAPQYSQAQTLNCPQPLIFGEFTVECPGASTATVQPTGGRTVTGCLSTGGAPFSNANCSVFQTFPFQNVQISVPSTIVMTRVSGTETIPVINFNLVSNGGGPVFSSSAPFINVPIGAQINTPGPIVSGEYQGTFTVNAVFN